MLRSKVLGKCSEIAKCRADAMMASASQPRFRAVDSAAIRVQVEVDVFGKVREGDASSEDGTGRSGAKGDSLSKHPQLISAYSRLRRIPSPCNGQSVTLPVAWGSGYRRDHGRQAG